MRPDLKIGEFFKINGVNDITWMVTDIGSRVIVAIAYKKYWMAGPPYATDEIVFDEFDFSSMIKVSDPEEE